MSGPKRLLNLSELPSVNAGSRELSLDLARVVSVSRGQHYSDTTQDWSTDVWLDTGVKLELLVLVRPFMAKWRAYIEEKESGSDLAAFSAVDRTH